MKWAKSAGDCTFEDLKAIPERCREQIPIPNAKAHLRLADDHDDALSVAGGFLATFT